MRNVRVTVSGRGPLAERVPPGCVLDLADGATVTDALAELGLPASACVTVVNGEVARPQTALSDGDRVQLYHQRAGG